jgi:hypothetical protein
LLYYCLEKSKLIHLIQKKGESIVNSQNNSTSAISQLRQLASKLGSVALLSTLTVTQVVQQLPFNLGSDSISDSASNQTAEAATPKTKTSTQASTQTRRINRAVDAIFNERYVQTRRSGNARRNLVGDPAKDELEFATVNLKVVLLNIANYPDWPQNKATAPIVRKRLMELYRSQVKGHILKGGRAYNSDSKQVILNQSIWERYTSIYAFASTAFGASREATRSNIQLAESIYPLIVKVNSDNLRLQYREQLREIKRLEKGNAESLYYLESYLTSLQQNIEANGEFRMLNIGPIGAVGSNLAIPNLLFDAVPLTDFLPNSWEYQKRQNKKLQAIRQYYLGQLAVRVSEAMNRMDARGIKIENSIRKLAGEFIPLLLDIGLDASDLATVRRAAKSSSLADDAALARRRSSGSSIADDVDNAGSGRNNRNNNRRSNSNPCLASAPYSGFIAVATDTPTMEFSSGAIVASSGLGAGEMLVASSGCLKTGWSDEFLNKLDENSYYRQLPLEDAIGEHKYLPPSLKNGKIDWTTIRKNLRSGGYIDSKGKIWKLDRTSIKPGQNNLHWDVQTYNIKSRKYTHINVNPNGTINHGR